MLFVLVSLIAAPAQASTSCDVAFHEAVAPPDAPVPPPLDRLLQFVYDVDESGELDATERSQRDSDLELRCVALDALLAEIDTNGDGFVDQDERSQLHDLLGPPPPPPPPHRSDSEHEGLELPPPAMRAYDTDRDRDLSAEERAVARDDLADRIRSGLPPIPPPEHCQ